MKNFFENFVQETFDESGRLIGCTYIYKPNFNFGYDVMDPLGEAEPDRLAMIWQNDKGEQVRLTYGQVKRMSIQTANLLAQRGFRRGDVLMTALRTHWEYWVVAVAAHRLGLILSPVYYLLTAGDFQYRMETAGVKGVVCCADGDTRERVARAADAAGGVDLRLSLEGGLGFEEFASAIAGQPDTMDRVDFPCTEPALLYFTSGTTGKPKAVLHDQRYMIANHTGCRYMQQVTEGSRHFATGDTGWAVTCGTKFYSHWMSQATLLVFDYDRFPPEKVLAFLAEVRATSMTAQPTVYRQFTEVGMDRYDLSAMRCYSVGGEKLTVELAETVRKQTGHILYEGYAQSESGLIAATTLNMGQKTGSMGKILPKYHVELLKDDGTFAKPGEEGEIVIVADGGVSPAGLTLGYWKDPEATRRLWDGSLFHTGDLAVRDEEDFLYYRGRADGIIKTKGYRVSPTEIEDLLGSHPAVKECLAVGVPDREMGQRVRAYVVLREGYTQDAAMAAELMAYHNDRAAGFKKIRELRFAAGLARSANGKLLRRLYQTEA